MSYKRTFWVNGETPINAHNLNKIEEALEEHSKAIGNTTDYEQLKNKPSINNVELSGNKTLSELGIASSEDVSKLNTKVDTIIEKAELNIKNTASGETIRVTDSADSKVLEFG